MLNFEQDLEVKRSKTQSRKKESFFSRLLKSHNGAVVPDSEAWQAEEKVTPKIIPAPSSFKASNETLGWNKQPIEQKRKELFEVNEVKELYFT